MEMKELPRKGAQEHRFYLRALGTPVYSEVNPVLIPGEMGISLQVNLFQTFPRTVYIPLHFI